MNIPHWLMNYAEDFIFENNFDSSHDMQHFLNVYNYCKDIVKNDYPSISLIEGLPREESLNILYNAGFSHDLIDNKYVDTEKAIIKLRNLFLTNGYKEEHVEIILFIIDNMSFSKQKKGIKIPEKYQLILDIVSDADKLDAYRPERVVAYQERKNMDENVARNWVKTILVKRVLKYKDEWLKTNYAKKICIDMHKKVEDYVKQNLETAEMYDY